MNGSLSKYHYENYYNKFSLQRKNSPSRFSSGNSTSVAKHFLKILFQSGSGGDYSDLMSLVQAQQTRLQSQQAEIKHVSSDDQIF